LNLADWVSVGGIEADAIESWGSIRVSPGFEAIEAGNLKFMDSNVNELFARTLTGNYDDDLPWKAVHTLRRLGSRDVFNRAAEWCLSDVPLKRARGADILAQIGRTADNPVNNFLDESFSIVSNMLRSEKDPVPLVAAVHALGHIGDPLAIPLVVPHSLHLDVDVRFAVACALGNFANDGPAKDALLALMRDADEDVRDRATFGLGVLGDLDSDEIRDALLQGISDPCPDVREESLVGLAKRKDQRALKGLIAALNQPEVSDRVREAAAELLGEQQAEHTSSYYVALLKERFPARPEH
jgi:HEAT repeat protein